MIEFNMSYEDEMTYYGLLTKKWKNYTLEMWLLNPLRMRLNSGLDCYITEK